MIALRNIIISWKCQFDLEIRKRDAHQRAVWLILKLEIAYKIRMRRRRQNTKKGLHRAKILGTLTFIGAYNFRRLTQQAKSVIAGFLHNHFAIYPLISANKKTYKKLIWIQKHIRNQLMTRHSKVEVLINYWDKMINKMMVQANNLRDQKIIKVLHRIIQIPKFIQRWILTLFVYRCRELYHIAFFQWRL